MAQQRPSIWEVEDPRTGDIYEIESPSMPNAQQVRSLIDQMTPPTRGGLPTRTHRTEDYMDPQEDRGSAVGRYASNLWDVVNPVNLVTGAYHAVTNPLETGQAILGQSADQLGRAREAFTEGRYSEAAGHAVGSVPVIGPIAAEAGQQIAEGDVAGGMGTATGILAPFGPLRGVTRAAVKAVPGRAATALEAGSASRVADAMSPKTNTNAGRRMGNKAQEIAPALAKDAEITGNWTRAGMQQAVASKLDDATAMLDEAADARLSALTFETKPILDALKAERRKLMAESVDASKPAQHATPRTSPIVDANGKPIQVTNRKAVPVGKDVTPAPNKAQAAQLDQAIAEIEALGPVARYEPLRRIRQAYDGPAKAVYNPSVTADYLVKRGESLGAAGVTGVLREQLAKFDPATATANAQYSLYRNANDILKAAEEIERVRPKVGRQIMARLTGTLFGGQQGGVAGAAAGYAAAPLVDNLANLGVTTKLQSAKLMQDLAAAIRKGDVGRVNSLSFKVRQLVKRAEYVREQGQQETETDLGYPMPSRAGSR